MTDTIKSGIAMVKVLEAWDIDHIFGIPGGSINTIMDALHSEQSNIKYIQVRHEEVGALAAVGETKMSGKIGVAFATAGPGATHLFQGLYDAKMDHVPMLALVGQVNRQTMNTDGFQEMDEVPMFGDVAVYNRNVMTAEQLPSVVDQAIKHSYEEHGPAVVTVPVDLGWMDIPDTFVPTAKDYRVNLPVASDDDIKKTLVLISQAKRPILYIGKGARGATKEVLEFAKMYQLPIASSALAKGIIPDAEDSYLKSAGRVATKPSVEALAETDLILFMGSDYPFAQFFFNPNAKFIQVDIDSSKLGKRHHTDLAILADVQSTLQKLIAVGTQQPETAWYQANIKNNQNWKQWVTKMGELDTNPLRIEPVFNEINRIAQDDAIFAVDVGNVTIEGVRFLEMNPNQSFTTSGWFATMGYALPAAIGGQVSYPNRQVFSISGDGGFGMVEQDIITQVKYNLPIINVVLSNETFGFIKAEQDDTGQSHYGVDIADADFGALGTALGAKGFTVRTRSELTAAFDFAKTATVPVVIDVKITGDRPLPVEQLQIDPAKFSADQIQKFNDLYNSGDLVPLTQYLADFDA